MICRLLAIFTILIASHACAQGGAGTAMTPARNGMNLSGIAPYSSQQPFLDRAKTMQWTADWQPIDKADLNADGFPARIPAGRRELQSSTSLDPTKQRYVLLYDGSAAVGVYDRDVAGKNVLGWGGSVERLSWKPGRIEFASAGSANWSISGFDAANPIRNIHIVRVDQEAAWRAGGIINPDWLAKFGKRFSPYRMMDWGCTNGSTLARWADRPKVSDATWPCVPVEMMIALANASDADLWLNVPHLADDEYVRQLATLVHATLAPAHKLHLEYSNEVWNGQFAQSKWAQEQADALWGKGAPVGWGNEVFYGYRSAQVMKIAKGVMGDRLMGVLATFPGWGDSQVDDAIARGVARAGLGPISGLFREYATTTYFGNELSFGIGNEADRPISLSWANGGGAGLDAAFAEIEHGGTMQANASLDQVKRSYRRHAAQAKAWGLDMVAYEGGFHIFLFMAPEAEKPIRLAFLNRLIADPRMGKLYARMLSDFYAAGGTVFANFNDIGTPGIFGAFGVLPDITATSPRYEALVPAGSR